MLRNNFMNGLLAIAALGAIITGYNAFIADDRNNKSASANIAEYLNLDVATQEKPESNDTQVTVDEGTTDESVAVDSSNQPDSQGSVDSSSTEDSDAGAVTTTSSLQKPETIYTVKEGDTYGCIAEKYYGSYEHWVDVLNANPSTDGFSEYELHVGARIVLPAVSAENAKPASSLCS